MNPEWGDFSFLKDNPGLLYFESTLYTENRASIHSKPGSKSQVGPESDVTGKSELWWLKKDGGGGRAQEQDWWETSGGLMRETPHESTAPEFFSEQAAEKALHLLFLS